MRIVAIPFLAAATALSACTGAPAEAPTIAPSAIPVAQATQAETISVEGVWVRAMPPGTPNTALFGTLSNGGTAQARLVGGASPLAGAVEIHTHAEVDGTMQMRRVEGLDVPGQGHLHLAPGGDHVMLIGLTAPTEAGSTASVTLRFADGSELAIDAPIQAEPASDHDGHAHDHDGH